MSGSTSEGRLTSGSGKITGRTQLAESMTGGYKARISVAEASDSRVKAACEIVYSV